MDPLTYPTNPLTGTSVASEPYETYDPPTRITWSDKIEYTRWAFYGGLVGAVLILIAAFITALLLTAMATFGGGLPAWAWGFDADNNGVRDNGFPEVPILIGVWGLLTGGAVILAALRAKERPERAALPGLLMMTAGILSFFALGGFFLGGLLAIVAGVLAVAGSRTLWTARAPRLRDREHARPGP